MARPDADSTRLIVIDDNPSIHNDIRRILSGDPRDDELRALEAALFDEAPAAVASPSYRVDGATSGQEGVEMARRAVADGDPYCIAIVDMRMPGGWDGLETIDRLWRVDRLVATVVCTAFSDYSWPEICGRLGNSARLRMLRKPFANLELWQLVDTLAEQYGDGSSLTGHEA